MMTHIDKWYFTEQAKYIFRKAGKAQINLTSEAAQDVLIQELIPIVQDILENYTAAATRNHIYRNYGSLN